MKSVMRWLGLWLLLAACQQDSDPARARDGQDRLVRLSAALDPTGRPSGDAFSPVITPDGRYVAFWFYGAGPPPGSPMLAIWDRQTGAYERVDGAIGLMAPPRREQVNNLALSADGRRLAVDTGRPPFWVKVAAPGAAAIAVLDRPTGAWDTVAVGERSGAMLLLAAASPVAMNATGRYVAFTSDDPRLVGEAAAGVAQVFVRDRQTGRVERMRSALARPGEAGAAHSPALSGDGRYVAFVVEPTAGGADDSTRRTAIEVQDRQTGMVERVSGGTAGPAESGNASHPTLSADGRYVAFYAAVPDAPAGGPTSRVALYVRDRQTGRLDTISVITRRERAPPDRGDALDPPSVSADGRYVAFAADAADMVAQDRNGVRDVFVWDRQAGAAARISVSAQGVEGNGASYAPAISADGRYIVFVSRADNLVMDEPDARDASVSASQIFLAPNPWWRSAAAP